MLRRLWAAEQAAAPARAAAPKYAQPPPPRALLVLPYLSIVSEKAADVGALLQALRWRVQGYQGERDKEGTPLAGKVMLGRGGGEDHTNPPCLCSCNCVMHSY